MTNEQRVQLQRYEPAAIAYEIACMFSAAAVAITYRATSVGESQPARPRPQQYHPPDADRERGADLSLLLIFTGVSGGGIAFVLIGPVVLAVR